LLAMWVGGGATSALFFSERLIYFPLGIFATALGTVLLPTFSSHAARSETQKIRDGISDGLRYLLFVMIPAAVGLLVLAHPIVQMIFEWKAFGETSTWMTAVALQCYAPGLVVFGLAKVFVPAFYGQQDTKTPVRVGLIAVGLNLILNVIFILILPQAIKHAGLAVATVLSSVANMACLAWILQKRLGQIDWRSVGATAWRSGAAAVAMGLAALWIHSLFPAEDKVEQIIAVLSSIAVAGVVYLLATLALRSPELAEFTRALHRKRS
jgi:putative peptidoglycan lipid II flippase